MVNSNISTSWEEFCASLQTIFTQVSFQDIEGKEMSAVQGFATWKEKTKETKHKQNYVYLIGNGASAAMASHFAADLSKNADVLTQTFTDVALITAMGNDEGYENVFAKPLANRGRCGDMLVTVSSSGNSPNVLKAIEVAKQKKMFVVTLSAMEENNRSRSLGHLNIYAPAPTFGLSETAHMAILHHWADIMLMCASHESI